MRLAGIQCDIVWEDGDANRARLGPLIDASARAGARLILLPEMFATGFSMATGRVAEPPDGETARFLREHAEKNAAWVGGSFACLQEEGNPTNRFLVAGPGGEQYVYDKIHPFSYGTEAEHYAAGSKAVTFTVDSLRITPFVCYDLRFGDWFWQSAEETDCYVVVANWPAPRQSHWTDLLRARAIENLAYVVGVNRVGRGGGLEYLGGSVVFGPFGEQLAALDDPAEEILFAEIDPQQVVDTRLRYPFLADRSPA